MDEAQRRRAQAIWGLIRLGWSPPVPDDVQTARMLDDMTKVSTANLELSPMERQVLTLTAEGMIRAQVAEALNVSPETVKEHLQTIYRKLGARNAAHATALGFRKGLLR